MDQWKDLLFIWIESVMMMTHIILIGIGFICSDFTLMSTTNLGDKFDFCYWRHLTIATDIDNTIIIIVVVVRVAMLVKHIETKWRRSTHDYGSHGPSSQHIDSTYNPGSAYRVSPTTSPNQSVDKAMREEQRGKKGFFSLFRSSKPDRTGLNQFSSSTNSDFYASSSKRQNFNDSRNFKTIREYSPRAFKFYMEQR